MLHRLRGDGRLCGLPFIVQASDLHPVHVFNALMKYADDSYLLVGSNNLSTATEEFDHISNWAGANNLRPNPQKTNELIVFKSSRRRVMPPSNPIFQGAVRVTTLRVLGVEISSDLGMSAHIEQVLASCASSMYALRVLRCHDLPPPQLHEVARATTIASLMYASPSWRGFSSAKDRSRMERLINKLKRSGFLPESAPSAVALAGEADQRLFKTLISHPTHVLRKHLPEVRQLSYNLRPRPHGFLLPSKNDRNFLSRLLYKDMY